MRLVLSLWLRKLEVESMQLYCFKLRVFGLQKDSHIFLEALFFLQLGGRIKFCWLLLQILIEDLEADQRF